MKHSCQQVGTNNTENQEDFIRAIRSRGHFGEEFFLDFFKKEIYR